MGAHGPAAVLLTGLSASGKTTLARNLVAGLRERGWDNVVLIDGEDVRRLLPREYGHSLADRETVWHAIVDAARREMDNGKVAVIATIGHRAGLRGEARRTLTPFFEVHLDCAVAVCAARDLKGQYERAFAGEYDCFIGVTHPYERADPVELRLDTGVLSVETAAALLLAAVTGFLAASAIESVEAPGL